MALELNGTTGVSLVQDGVVTAADLASGAVTTDKIALPDLVSVAFPSNTTTTISAINATSYFNSYFSNNISVSAFESGQPGGDIWNEAYTHHTISGITNGVYEFHIQMGMDRNSNSSQIQMAVFLEEDGTKVASGYDETVLQGYGGCSLHIIRDYRTSVPTTIKVLFEADKGNYITLGGAQYTIKRIA